MIWTGEPLVYKRAEKGSGLIIGKFHYRFDAEGRLEALDVLTRPVLERILKVTHPNNHEMVSLAYAETPGRALERSARQAESPVGQTQEIPS